MKVKNGVLKGKNALLCIFRNQTSSDYEERKAEKDMEKTGTAKLP